MVCVPCIIIPLFLWIFHKFIQPYVLKFWNPWKSVDAKKGEELNDDDVKSEEYVHIQRQIKDNTIIIFTKQKCTYCSMAKEVFAKLGVSYELEMIDGEGKDTAKIQQLFAKITGSSTVPRVFVGGRCIGGGSETYSLYNEGKLLQMLQKLGVDVKKQL